ncbi:hypothetical protein MUA73_04975 [Staphylococcus simulans]|uniref:hypothetical protein n=1 Tax=Staphylococcus simulans TaxID=1286 RepID=UPI0021CFC29F|nr:hypothetical protein [Staphylococcus simulans]UXR31225.1 hypothetical protein MUA73_04975 [Staphylococcus simulans]UXR33681.1 hypothetical protein MUA81_04900 [Staphylococcus simulans]
MDKNYILKLLKKQELDHIKLTLISGEKISVCNIGEDNSKKEVIEVLEPTKITVNLKYVVTIEEIYPPNFDNLNELSF